MRPLIADRLTGRFGWGWRAALAAKALFIAGMMAVVPAVAADEPGLPVSGDSGGEDPGDPGDPIKPCDPNDPDTRSDPDCADRDTSGANYVWEEFGKRIDTSQKVAAMGPDLFGDQVNLIDGGLSFAVTDVSVPGNSALPVAFSRSFRVENRFRKINDSHLADWHLDLPHISATYATDWKSSYPGNPDRRCSVLTAAQARPPANANLIPIREFWQGIHLHLPEGGGGELLLPNAGLPTPGVGGPYYWTVGATTRIGCLATINNGTGEGFVAITHDGTRYSFGHMAQFHEPHLRSNQGHFQPRRRNALYVTRVEDRFGHWVTYSYGNAWNQPIKLTSIQASDGRSLAVSYNPTGQIASVSTGGRTWQYQYTTVPGTSDRSLSEVILPDTSRWTLALAAFSKAYIEYPRPEPWSGQPPFPEVIRDCFILAVPFGPNQHTGSVTHPAGAKGTFTVNLKEHGRSQVPVSCSNISEPHNDLNDDVNLHPNNYHTWSLTTKTVEGPGLASMQWNYAYGRSATDQWYFFPGSSREYPVCPFGVDCTVPTCQSDACAGYNETTVTGPGGEEWLRYRHGNTYRYNEGKLLTVDSGTGPNQVMNIVTHQYDLSQSAQAYPARYGTSARELHDAFTAEYHRPLLRTRTTRQSTTFTWEVATGCGTGSHCFDAFARPTRVNTSSTLGFGKVEAMTYHDNTTRWVLGQLARRRDGTAGPYIEQVDYDATTALPTNRYAFGKLVERRAYHANPAYAGQLYQLYDGGNVKKTTLTDYHRGIPRSVTFHDGKTQTATVNDRGDITSVTDERGHTTAYQYDTMGRISQITYPAGDLNAWTATVASFQQVPNAEYGLPVGHWRQITRTGNDRRVTYFDALWRPVLSEHYDLSQVAATNRIVQRKYNHRGQETFRAYPLRSIAAWNSSVPGVATTYDALGRPTRHQAHSELGLLTTTYAYLAGFKTRLTNPRGYATTTHYLAYDQPTTDWPVQIDHPLAITTTIPRDTWGKPTAVTRAGTWQGTYQIVARRFVYDAHQRLCKTIDPESGSTVQKYDASNNIAWTAAGQALNSSAACQIASVPADQRSTRSYDARNRLTLIDHPAGTPDTAFTYHPNGQLASTTNDGSTWTYTYDKRGFLRTETLAIDGLSFAFTHGYTAIGHRASLQYPDGAANNFLPNAIGQPTRASSWATAATWHPNGALAGFTYGNGTVHTQTLNTRQLPLRQRDVRGSLVRLDYTLDWDANANLALLSDDAPGNEESGLMTYDALDRLTRVQRPASPHPEENYVYDVLDNLRQTRFGPGTGALTFDYTLHGSTNRMTRMTLGKGGSVLETATYGYDARGNMTTRRGHTHAYDAANRMLWANTGTQTENYRYDGHGRRTRIQRAGGNTYQVYGLDGKLLYERAPNGTTTRHAYLGNRRVAAIQGATTRYHHTNHLGSVIVTTNADGSQHRRQVYASYGSAWDSADYAQAPGFTGHVTDLATTLHYMQQRYDDPVAMRFASVDPAHVDTTTGANFNRYAYANNNPYTYTDPDGRESGCFYGGGCGGPASATQNAIFSAALDYVPIVGDIKGIVDAIVDPSAGNILAAVAGLMGPVGDSAAAMMKGGGNIAENAAKGKASEARVLSDIGETKNTAGVSTSQGRTIPDFQNSSQVGEIKDTARVSDSSQLRAQREHAQATGREHVVVTGSNTQVSGTVRDQSTVIRRDDLGPRGR